MAGLTDLLQRPVIGIVAHADERRHQRDLAEESDVGIDLDARRVQHRVRARDRGLDVLRLPVHVLRQRRKRAENPQHVIARRDFPQTGSRLLAGDDDGRQFRRFLRERRRSDQARGE